MNDQIRLLIHNKKSVYDDILISLELTSVYNKNNVCEKADVQGMCNNVEHQNKNHPIHLCRRGLNAYLISAYIYTINSSKIYRKSAVNVLRNYIQIKIAISNTLNSIILIKLQTPKHQFLDYNWGEKLTQMVMERQEIDHAMSWLSTLGGAFSALGDQHNYFAKIAGKISVEQFKLAMRLGDPQLVARCKLYAALSLLQQGYLKVSKHLIKEIYTFAIEDKDIRLQRMCQGVWAKLKYYYSQRKSRNKKIQKVTPRVRINFF